MNEAGYEDVEAYFLGSSRWGSDNDVRGWGGHSDEGGKVLHDVEGNLFYVLNQGFKFVVIRYFI